MANAEKKFNALAFFGYPSELFEIVANDATANRIKEEKGELSDEYFNRVDELQKENNIPEVKNWVWVRDSHHSKPYLKYYTRQEHYQHYLSLGNEP